MSKIFFKSFFLFFLFFSIPLYPNIHFKLDNWKTYTSLLNVNCAIEISNNEILVGTTGGAFILTYSAENDSFLLKNTLFQDFNITALAYNKTTEQVFLGTQSGTLIILDLKTNPFQTTYINDIKNAKLSNPQINDIVIYNELCYIAGDFGIAIFNLQKGVFIDSIFKLGEFSTNTKVNSILIHKNEIWAGCETGIAQANLNSILADPDSWKNFDTKKGLSEPNIKKICIFNDTLFAISSKNLYQKQADTFLTIKVAESWNLFNSIFIHQNNLLLGTYYNVFNLDYSIFYNTYPNQINSSHSININNNPLITLLSQQNGIGFIQNDSIKFIEMNTPSTNLMGQIATYENSIWIATDKGIAGRGLMLFRDGKWHNIYFEKYNTLKTNAIHKITPIDDYSAIACSWGHGFFIIKIDKQDSLYLLQYNQNNSALKGISTDPNYVVTGEAKFDNKKTLWIVNTFTIPTDPVLIAMDENNNFYSFTNCSPNANNYITLTIDKYNTKWLGSIENSGLLYINENNTLANKSDDICGSITTTGTNLPSNTITALEVDESGFLWIGTSSGLAVLLNPNFIFQNATPFIRKITSLGNQAINDIMIDALNNKWIATPNGVWVLNSDASEVIEIITTQKHPINNNNIISLATNKKNGKIYFSSNNGLYEAQSLSITPLQEFDLKIYPQPFFPLKQSEIFFEGLTQNTTLIITTTNGEHIKTLTAEGRKVIWDGKLDDGSFINSGVYLVIASSSTTNSKSVGKFVVIR